uniref:hypothetical protein n=1 Tax=Staphylococcus epidermidis TaxID=1282 RepID=UPI001C92E140
MGVNNKIKRMIVKRNVLGNNVVSRSVSNGVIGNDCMEGLEKRIGGMVGNKDKMKGRRGNRCVGKGSSK